MMTGQFTVYGFPLWRGRLVCCADRQGLWGAVQPTKKLALNPRDDACIGGRRRCWRSWGPKASR